jgi:hypothetical protein
MASRPPATGMRIHLDLYDSDGNANDLTATFALMKAVVYS